MENCGQCTLERVIAASERRRFSQTEAFFIFSQLIDGLEILHQFGGCHRGINPGNLILQKDLKVKIIGFHNAVRWCETINSQQDLTAPNLDGEVSTNKLCWLQQVVGDFRYIPPELMSHA